MYGLSTVDTVQHNSVFVWFIGLRQQSSAARLRQAETLLTKLKTHQRPTDRRVIRYCTVVKQTTGR